MNCPNARMHAAEVYRKYKNAEFIAESDLKQAIAFFVSAAADLSPLGPEFTLACRALGDAVRDLTTMLRTSGGPSVAEQVRAARRAFIQSRGV